MKSKKMKPQKEPSLLRKLVEIHWEQMKQRREIKRLSKQEWSFDFLCAMLVRSGKLLGQGVQLEITNKQGQKIVLTYQKAEQAIQESSLNENIFDKLDDQVAVQKFIREHSVR